MRRAATLAQRVSQFCCPWRYLPRNTSGGVHGHMLTQERKAKKETAATDAEMIGAEERLAESVRKSGTAPTEWTEVR